MMKLKKKVPKLFVPSSSSNSSKCEDSKSKASYSALRDYQWFCPEDNSSSRSKSSIIAQEDDISTSALSSASAYEDSKNNSNTSSSLTAEKIAKFTAGGRRSKSMMQEFHKNSKNSMTTQQQSQSRQDHTIKTSCRRHRRNNSDTISIQTDQTPIIHNLEISPPRTRYREKKNHNISCSWQHQQLKQQKGKYDHEGPVDVDAVSCDGSTTSGDEDEEIYFLSYNSEIIIRKDRRNRQPHAGLSINPPHLPDPTTHQRQRRHSTDSNNTHGTITERKLSLPYWNHPNKQQQQQRHDDHTASTSPSSSNSMVSYTSARVCESIPEYPNLKSSSSRSSSLTNIQDHPQGSRSLSGRKTTRSILLRRHDIDNDADRESITTALLQSETGMEMMIPVNSNRKDGRLLWAV